MSAQVKALTERARAAEERLQAVLATLPNLPDPTAAAEDTVLREVGEPRVREGRDHLALAGDMIDMERGARLSGSRFAYLRGPLVMGLGLVDGLADAWGTDRRGTTTLVWFEVEPDRPGAPIH